MWSEFQSALELHGLFLLYFLAYQSRCSDFIIPAGMSEASGGHLSIWRRARGSDSKIHATLQIKTWQFFLFDCNFTLSFFSLVPGHWTHHTAESFNRGNTFNISRDPSTSPSVAVWYTTRPGAAVAGHNVNNGTAGLYIYYIQNWWKEYCI